MFVTFESKVGRRVVLLEEKGNLLGKFVKDSIVTITDVDPQRGYTFEDSHGNRVSEAGFTGFRIIAD